MPSFDIVSIIDKQELRNAIDQTNRELCTRFDLKGIDARVDNTDNDIVIIAEVEFQTRQILEILHSKLAKRKIDINCIEIGELSTNLAEARQKLVAKEGIDKELGRTLIKILKGSKLKIQTQMQDNQLRVSSKSRNVLQEAIQKIKDSKQKFPLQFENFRD